MLYMVGLIFECYDWVVWTSWMILLYLVYKYEPSSSINLRMLWYYTVSVA